MTAFDRIEPRLPELLDELAATPTIPDYFDALLWQTATTSQKPAWASIERWLPMIATARAATNRPFPFRLLAIAAALVLLAAVAIIVATGSRQRDIPAPFGPARNGLVFVGNDAGDILAIDPATGSSDVIVGGATTDASPLLSRDGRRFIFLRGEGDERPIWIADADGSGARELVPAGHFFVTADWSATGDRIAFGEGELAVIVDTANGDLTTIDLGMPVNALVWRPESNELIVGTAGQDAPGATRDFFVVTAEAGAVPRPVILDVPAISEPSVSPDGTSITYTTWEDSDPGLQGRIHVVAIATGVDRLLTDDLGDGYHWEDARFSPDGQWIVSDRYARGGGPYQVTAIAVDDPATQVALGGNHLTGTGGSWKAFTPDSTAVLVKYGDDGSQWLLPLDGSPGREVDWSFLEEQLSWQRLAR